GKRAAGKCGPQGPFPAQGPARSRRHASAGNRGSGGGAKRDRPLLTRAWLAAALAQLRGCVILSADAGLLARVAELPGGNDHFDAKPGVERVERGRGVEHRRTETDAPFEENRSGSETWSRSPARNRSLRESDADLYVE